MTVDGFVRRDRCVVCCGTALEPILTVPAFPVFQGCVTFAPGVDEAAPMPWAACEACGSAQITVLPSLDRVYLGGHATGLGASWARHHAAFAQFLLAHAPGPVVDIGGGSGTLAAAFRRCGGAARWTILEPNALACRDIPDDVSIVDGFLERDALQRIGAQTVVMCHMLEHVVDLRATLADLTATTGTDPRIVIAWPVLEQWTARGLAGALNFEHGIYVTLARLKSLFGEFGWQLEAQADWPENNTVFLSFKRGKTTAPAEQTSSARSVVADYFAGFATTAARLNSVLKEHDGDAFLMPASVYAQALIAAGLSAARFVALVDNAEIKQGRRLYGTQLVVQSPSEALACARRPLVVVNAGAHTAEIAAGLRRVRDDVVIIRADALVPTPVAA